MLGKEPQNYQLGKRTPLRLGKEIQPEVKEGVSKWTVREGDPLILGKGIPPEVREGDPP